MRHILALIVTLGIAASVDAAEPKLPKPPDGFQWQWCKEIRAAFLLPKAWHFKYEKRGETHGYFITREEIKGAKGKFNTGLSVNVIPGISKKTKDKPPKSRGRLKTFGCRVKKDGSVVHSLLIANDEDDKLYLVLFESPEKEWKDDWKTGDTIMKKLYFEFPK